MEIDNDLVIKWEPKIQKLLTKTFIVGMDRDDIAQELRIAIIKAAQGFQEDKGVIFHTYLHTSMVNTIRTLISKGQRIRIEPSLETSLSLEIVPSDLLKAMEDSSNTFENVEFDELIDKLDLTEIEKRFIILRVEGMTMDEISEDLKTSAYTSLAEAKTDLTKVDKDVKEGTFYIISDDNRVKYSKRGGEIDAE